MSGGARGDSQNGRGSADSDTQRFIGSETQPLSFEPSESQQSSGLASFRVPSSPREIIHNRRQPSPYKSLPSQVPEAGGRRLFQRSFSSSSTSFAVVPGSALATSRSQSTYPDRKTPSPRV